MQLWKLSVLSAAIFHEEQFLTEKGYTKTIYRNLKLYFGAGTHRIALETRRVTFMSREIDWREQLLAQQEQ